MEVLFFPAAPLSGTPETSSHHQVSRGPRRKRPTDGGRARTANDRRRRRERPRGMGHNFYSPGPSLALPAYSEQAKVSHYRTRSARVCSISKSLFGTLSNSFSNEKCRRTSLHAPAHAQTQTRCDRRRRRVTLLTSFGGRAKGKKLFPKAPLLAVLPPFFRVAL